MHSYCPESFVIAVVTTRLLITDLVPFCTVMEVRPLVLTVVSLWVQVIMGTGNPDALQVRMISSWMLVTFTENGGTRITGETAERSIAHYG